MASSIFIADWRSAVLHSRFERIWTKCLLMCCFHILNLVYHFQLSVCSRLDASPSIPWVELLNELRFGVLTRQYPQKVRQFQCILGDTLRVPDISPQVQLLDKDPSSISSFQSYTIFTVWHHKSSLHNGSTCLNCECTMMFQITAWRRLPADEI